jgi:hypothetical protein
MQSEGRLADAQATYNTQDDNECRSHGATTGTDPYFQCRRELAKDHVEAEAARQAQQRALDQPPPSSADPSR